MRTKLLKTHIKAANSAKALSNVVAEARAIESAMEANKLTVDFSKGIEAVYWTNYEGSQTFVSRVATGKAHIPGRYLLLMRDRVPTVVVMTI